jgi:hypothetical protein
MTIVMLLALITLAAYLVLSVRGSYNASLVPLLISRDLRNIP